MKTYMPMKNKRFNGLFLSNFFIILFALLIPFALICTAIYFYFERSFLKEFDNTSKSALNRVVETSDTTLANAKTLAINLSLEETVTEFVGMEKTNAFTYDQQKAINKLTKLTNYLTNQYVGSVSVYSNRNGYLVGNVVLNVKEYLAMKKDTQEDLSWLPYFEDDHYSGGLGVWPRVKSQRLTTKKRPCITVASCIPVDGRYTKQGLVLLDINYDWASAFLKSSGEHYLNFYILDQNGTVIYNDDDTKLSKNFWTDISGCSQEDFCAETINIKNINGKDTLINTVTSAGNGWQYLYFSDLSDHYRRIESLKITVMWAMLGLVFFAVFVSYMISLKVFLPVRQIIELISDPGKFYKKYAAPDARATAHPEMNFIINSFVQTLSKSEKYEQELTKYMIELKNSQIALLQSQINPHFLFNTLQTINFMVIAISNTDNEASQAIGKLAVMLRKMIHVEENMITIQDELAYSKAYIELEQLRNTDGFTIHWEVEESVLLCKTVKITMQPILENSIRHGFARKDIAGEITVKIFSKGQNVIFLLRDNGVGQPTAWIDEKNRELKEAGDLKGEHIGISNVNQRIKMIYGKEYGVEILPCETGFAVQITIPKVE